MNFIKRLGYYLFGFAIGLIFLFYFLNEKNTKFNYSPQSRVLNDLDKKKWFFEFSADSIKIIDSIKKNVWIKEGKINFKKSNTKLDTCKIYCLETFYNQKKTDIYIKNCKKNVLVYSIIDNADK